MNQNEIWNNITIPSEIDRIIQEAVDAGYREMQIRKKNTGGRLAASFAGMAAALIVFAGAGFLNPVIAEAYCGIPLVGNIFSYLYRLEKADIKYAQVAESAEPFMNNRDEKLPLTTADPCGLNLRVQEAYCDGSSLYLSMQLVKDTPFFEEGSENQEGFIQIISSETILTDSGETQEIGSGSLNLYGVFTDANTFVGIARSGKTLEEYSLPEETEYTLLSRHIKIYSAGEAVADIRGEWEYSGTFKYSAQPLETKALSVAITDGFALQEVRLQPYEIQIAVTEPINSSLAEQALCIEAFDEKGNRLKPAADAAARFIRSETSQSEIWMFERPEDAQSVTFYVMDDRKWLDEWKGYLYREDPWSGEQIMKLLDDNCLARAEVKFQ